VHAKADESAGHPGLFIIPHTHWDREWYLPFQSFRHRLVKLVDDLLGLLDRDPEFTAFMLDGQSIVIEDYLEVRPEMEKKLRHAIETGRILVGPWYILPDEHLVSGEAIIRNLERGMLIARHFGGSMEIGYLPDQFGHIASMPAILTGFGFDTACLWRGVGQEVQVPVFRWESQDGSSVKCIYLPNGYGNAARLLLDKEGLRSAVDKIVARLDPWYERLQKILGTRPSLPLLLMNGTDHLPAQAGLPQSLRALEGQYNWTIGTLPQYARLVSDVLREDASILPVCKGELRSPERAPLLVGVTSTRHWIKQKDWMLSNTLERYAEPLNAVVGLIGKAEAASHDFLDLAWKYLLQNHPHDSICGCSVDQVHRDMAHRFDQCEFIVKQQVENAGIAVARWAARALGVEEPAIVVFNPGPASAQSVVEVDLTGFPPGTTCLADCSGKLYPVQVRAKGEGPVSGVFHPGNLPSMGVKVFRLASGYSAAPEAERARESQRGQSCEEVSGAPVPVRAGRTYLDNGLLRIEVNDDGSFRLTDLETGTVYPAVNRFVDSGDRGDEYNWDPPARDLEISAPSRSRALSRQLSGSRPPFKIRVEETGPVQATIRVDMTYLVPEGLTEDRDGRSAKLVPLRITTRASLMTGVKRVDFRTTVENRSRDHRLRVHFAVPFRASRSQAACQFQVVERPVTEMPPVLQQPGPDEPRERPPVTHPMRRFVDVSDGTVGLSISTKGLYEYGIIPGEVSEVALTLMRCVGWLSRSDLRIRRGHAGPEIETPEAQCPGVWNFEYSVYPHKANWHDGETHLFAEAYQCPPVCFRTDRPLRRYAGDSSSEQRYAHTALPVGSGFADDGSLFSVAEPDLTWSSLRMLRSGEIIVRLYNIGSRSGRTTLRSFVPLKDAARTDLRNIDTGEPVELVNPYVVEFNYKGYEIITLRLRPERQP